MEETRDIALADPEATRRLGAELAALLRPGDLITLAGPIGAGKTELARAIALALTAAGTAPDEVPSPTFTLAQFYPDLRVPLTHFDFYRIEDPAELAELGLEEALDETAVLVEWPDRMDALPADRLEVTLTHAPSGTPSGAVGRTARLTGHGTWGPRLARARALAAFLDAAGWGTAERRWLKGDASTRRYERLVRGSDTAVAMDWPPAVGEPAVRDGLPYSRLAHLATESRAFLAVGRHLKSLALSVPTVLAADAAAGLLLLEDFGDLAYGDLVAADGDVAAGYDAALGALLALQEQAAPAVLEVGDGAAHRLAAFDLDVYLIEVELLLDWYWPHVRGEACPEPARVRFRDIWRGLIGRLEPHDTLVLRDFHSPNLLWLEGRRGARQCGLIDFQDALIGHPAYDLVSLLQDARIDLPDGLEDEVLAQYLARRPPRLAGGDPARFRADYAIVGAQRATRLLGLFVRLAKRDAKPAYLAHMPRIAAYLARNLEAPVMADYRAWLAETLDLAAPPRRLVRAG